MAVKTKKSYKRQDRALAGARWLFLLGMILLIGLTRAWADPPNKEYVDLAIASGVGAAIVLILTISTLIPSFNPAAPMILSGGDVILAGLYAYTAANGGESGVVGTYMPEIFVAIAGFLLVTGMLRLGATWGSVQAIVVIAITLGACLYPLIQNSVDQQLDWQLVQDAYVLPVLVVSLLAVATGIWLSAQDTGEGKELLTMQKTIQSHEKQASEMNERARALTEVIMILSSTLDYKKVLNTALDIGQFGLAQAAGQRVVSLVLLFDAEGRELYVANSRGLKPTDENTVIPGVDGIVGQALQESAPIIGKDAAKDRELAKFVALHTIRSVLCIPLRAHYDNFGVLIYGSNQPNAFRADIIDTLAAIGMQVATALENATLYSTLKDERELVIQLEEDARKALVRDLHDIPTQTMSAVAMRLRIIKRMLETGDKEALTELDAAETMALRATEEIRHVLFKLRPLALETHGLTAALNQLAEKIQLTYKQPCTMDIHPDVELYLDEAKQGALFYLIEEAINNARKYAEASMITVQAHPQNSMIAVRIHDNGVGFDTASVTKSYSKRGSFGMVNMRERAQLLDGTLTIESQKGQGTSIIVMIPIDLSQKSTTTGTYAQVPKTKLVESARRRMDREGTEED